MKPSRSKRWTRDEIKAREWAAIAVQYHQWMEAKGGKIPFPDVCFCAGTPHKYGEAPDRTVHYRGLGAKREPVTCPVVSKKTHEARVKALGEAINAS